MPKVTPKRSVIASGKRLDAGKSADVSEKDATLLGKFGLLEEGEAKKGRRTSKQDGEGETR